jgi:hypothetical protein
MPTGLTFVSSSAEAARNGMVWNFTTVPVGAQYFTVKATVFSGTANNTVVSVKATLNYSDARGKMRPGSTASASVTVIGTPVNPPVDITSPSIIDRKPGPSEKNIEQSAKIEITFSEPMNKTSAEKAFVISPSVKGTFSWDGNKLIFTPDKELKKGQKYIIKIEPTQATDLAGNHLNPISSWSFTVKGKATSVQQPYSMLCIVGVLGLVVIIILAIAYLMPKKKAAPPTRSAKRPSERTYEEETATIATVAPRGRRAPVEEEVPEEELPSAAPEVVEEETIDLASKDVEPSEEPAPVETEAPAQPLVEEPTVPQEKVEEPAPPQETIEETKSEEPMKEEPAAEEKTSEPVPELKEPEPAVEQKVEPGPPELVPGTKIDEKKTTSDLDDILKKLRS